MRLWWRRCFIDEKINYDIPMIAEVQSWFDDEEKQLYTQRTVDGKVNELKYSDESDGTKKLIAALPVLLLALQEGCLVSIDELDAKLHPKLLREDNEHVNSTNAFDKQYIEGRYGADPCLTGECNFCLGE